MAGETIYVKCVRDGIDSYSAHGGMSIETVTDMLEELGATDIEVISKETFDAAVAVQPAV